MFLAWFISPVMAPGSYGKLQEYATHHTATVRGGNIDVQRCGREHLTTTGHSVTALGP